MMNLNEMSSKQLKALGKEHRVKDWWNLNKAALISALSEILVEEDACEQEPEVVEVEEAAAEPETTEETAVEELPKKPNLHLGALTFEGKTQSIRAWAEELEMPWPTLYDRVNRNGWTVEEALTTPLGQRRKK